VSLIFQVEEYRDDDSMNELLINKSENDNSVVTTRLSGRKEDDENLYKLRKETPKSPFKRVSDVITSPVRFMQRKFRAGGLKGSIFSLVTAILGSGTITLPYLAAKNGIVLTILLIAFGAAISYFAGMLLVK